MLVKKSDVRVLGPGPSVGWAWFFRLLQVWVWVGLGFSNCCCWFSDCSGWVFILLRVGVRVGLWCSCMLFGLIVCCMD
ncbi:hypothetical protein Hanom_Chr00s000001g01597191 [Helianthus anomalus]